MKNNIFTLLFLSVFTAITTGCNPRIDFDPGQYGEHAVISSVVCFTLDTASHKLQEYYQTGKLVPGIQRKAVAFNEQPDFSVVDTTQTNVSVYIPKIYDMTHMGLFFNTESEKIVPLSGAPTPGILTDLTKGQPFKYEAVSSNGFKRVYVFTITSE